MDFLSKKPMDMSLGKVKEQAALSANSYKEHYVGEKVTIDGHSYVVEKFVNSKDSGFSATLYRKENTNEHTIAYRGTDKFYNDGIKADIIGGIKNKNSQNPDREKFTKEAINQISKNFGGNIEKAKANTTLTGHSLGGNHAQTSAYETGMNTYTFNSFGANSMIRDMNDFNSTKYNKNANNVLNVNVKGDPVTPIKNQYGRSIEIGSNKIEKLNSTSGIEKLSPLTSTALQVTKAYLAHTISEMLNALSELPNETIFNPKRIPSPLDPSSYPYFPDNDGTTRPLDPYTLPNIFSQVYDPLTLDLNGDGKISTLNLSDGVYFDHNKDGVAFKSSWIGKEDGILVLDKNLNNKIDDGNELFGNFTKIEESKFAINGYHALSLQDTNNDGKIDALDENFSKLKIWQDLNSDGISQANELKTLEEHGIKSISLNFSKPTNSDDILTDSSDSLNNLNNNSNSTNNPSSKNDNKATIISSFTRDDNTTGLVADIDLKVDTINSKHTINRELSTEELLKANIRGQGFLNDLNISATLSPELSNMLDNYSNLKTRQEQVAMLPSLINAWVNSNVGSDTSMYCINKAVISQTRNTDAKILSLLENLSNLDKNDIDYKAKSDYLKSEIKALTEITSNVTLKNYDKLIDSVKYGGEISLNNRDIRVTPSQLNRLKSYQISKELLDEFNSIKYKLKVIDSFTGVVTKPLYYTSQDDVRNIINHINKSYDNIIEYSYKTLLTQTRLKEYMNLLELDVETIEANGTIKYSFKLDHTNALNHFKEINTTNPRKAFTDLAEFITMFESKNDIKDGIALLSNFAIAAKEKGVIKEYLNTLSSKTISDLSTQTGSLNNDTLIGSNILDGKDTLYGLDGDDILIGGVGDDTLIGGSGSDTYLYEDKNFGNDIIINNSSNNLNSNSSSNINSNNPFIKDKDIIKFKGNIKKEDIIYKRVMDNGVISNDLIILLKDEYSTLINNINTSSLNNPNSPIIDKSLLKNTNNSIIIKDFFKDDDSMISSIEFDNGSIKKNHIINSLLTTSNFNDYINPFDKDKNYRIDSKDGDDTIITHNGNDTILAGNGNDAIDSGGGNDYIDGGSGNDDIYAGDGDDTLIGGSGNDTLQGGMGNDTYVFGRGFGNDVILNFNPNNETDTIKFIDGISQDELNFKSIDGNLVISFKDKSIKDTITISNFFKDKNYMITNIEFDKSYMSLSDIMNKVILSTDDNSNNINVIDDNSYVIDGKGGDDIITASSGNDTIIGGSGNDTLTGGLGSDTYKFDDNFGNDTIINYNPTLKDIDTIEFTSKNITKESLNFSKDKNDLLIVKDELNSIRVKDYFLLNYNKEPVNAINTIKFANKTTLSIKDIDKLLISNSSDKNDEISTISSKNFTINAKGGDDVITTNGGDDYIDGGNGNDIISSGSGDDILIGGKGNDTLNGGSGNDTYIFERGFGNDTIINYNPDLYTDTVEFKGINKDELTFKQIDSNLVISFKDATIKDSLTIKDFYKLDYKQRPVNAISLIKFNNEILNLKDINDLALKSISNDGDKISVVTSDDYIVNGGNGNDTITTNSGNDIINGGRGNDILNGGKGNDTYVFERGFGNDTIINYNPNLNSTDTIKFIDGITLNDLSFSQDGNNLYITMDDKNSVTVKGFFNEQAIKKIEFSDGKTLNLKDILSLSLKGTTDNNDTLKVITNDSFKVEAKGGDDKITLNGGNDYIDSGDGNDTIYAGDGNDIIIGGSGNDSLNGGSGSDTYKFARGFGKDLIINTINQGEIETIEFIDDIKLSELKFSKKNLDLVVGFKDDTITDSITIKDFYKPPYDSGINRVKFSDSTILNLKDINDLVLNSNSNDLAVNTNHNYTINSNIKDVTITTLGGNDDITSTGNSYIDSGAGDDSIITKAGKDTIKAGSGRDYINSGDGDDYIDAGNGDDILVGGSGNDTLIGGLGSDTYEFSGNFGKDIIINEDERNTTDKIKFSDDTKASDLKFYQDDNKNLIISKGKNSITIKGFYSFNKDGMPNSVIDQIQFNDGSYLNLKEINALALLSSDDSNNYLSVVTNDSYEVNAKGGDDFISTLGGDDKILSGSGSDKIYSGAGNDYIDAGDGNDIIDAGSGNDILIGGKGDDTLIGGSGSDTYIFNKEFGDDLIIDGDKDVIKFSSFTKKDISFKANKDDLVINTSDNSSIRVKNFYKEPTIGKIEFSDGSFIKASEILNLSLLKESQGDDIIHMLGDDDYTINSLGGDDDIITNSGNDYIDGGSGNDSIKSGAGDDTIIGGSGNDILSGEAGNDTYIFYSNFGNDTIINKDSSNTTTDTIWFKEHSLKDLEFIYKESNGNLTIKDSSNNSIVIKDFKNDPIDKFIFKDNTTILKEDIANIATIIGNDDKVFVNGYTNAGFGNDTYKISLSSNGGVIKDLFTLFGTSVESGNDTIEFSDDVKNINYSKDKNSLIINADGGFKLTIKDYFTKNSSIENVKFSDGRISSFKDEINPFLAPILEKTKFSLDEDSILKENLSIKSQSNTPLKFEILSNPNNASLTIDKNGALSFRPNSNFNGSDSAIIKITDEFGFSTTKELSFDINPINDAPVFDSTRTNYTLQDIREISGVLKASDIDSSTLTYKVVSNPTNGSMTLNKDGAFTYKPNDFYMGEDKVIVEVSDGELSSTKELIFNSVISAPIIDSTKFKFNEDTVFNNSLKIINPSNSKLTYELVGDGLNSSVFLKDDGSFMITPNLNYNGEDFITIKVTNEYGLSDIKTIALNILPVNDAPSITNKDESNFILEDVRYQTGQIIASDVDNDKLSYRVVKHPSNGKLNLDSNTGKWSYELISKESSSAIIEVSDLHGAKDTITLNFSSKISAPTIITDTFKFDEDTTLSGNLSYVNNIGGDVKFELINNPKNSKITLDNSGKYTITPNANFNGNDSIKVKVTNEFGISFEKVINININPINDAPEFKERISNYELTNTDKVIANLEAFDIDSNNLTYKVVSNPTNGFITIDKSGNFTYTSNKGYKGSDSVIVEVSDGKLSTTKELKFNMNGYEYNGGNLEIPSNDLIDTTLKLPNLNIEDIKFNRSNNDLILTQNSGDITIKDYFTKGAKTIDTLIFKNNQTININNTKLVLPNKKSWQIKPSANLNNSGIIFSDLENSILNGSNKDDIIISTGDNSKIHAKDGNDTIILNGNKNEAYGSSKNDTLISNGKNNFLKGENADDTYIIGKDANNTIIRDKEYVNLIDGGNDTLILNDIDKSSVEFKLGGSFNKDLIINYSNSNSKDIKTLTIQNQTNKYSAIENINLDGTMLGTETINKIIQDLNSYSDDKGLSLNSFIKAQDKDMLQIYQG